MFAAFSTPEFLKRDSKWRPNDYINVSAKFYTISLVRDVGEMGS